MKYFLQQDNHASELFVISHVFEYHVRDRECFADDSIYSSLICPIFH